MAPVETAEVLSTLNDLVEMCEDNARGFRAAAKGAKNPLLNAQFNSYAQQRDLFAAELQTEARRLAYQNGGAEAKGGGPAATLRSWVPSRASEAGLDEAALIADRLQQEEAAMVRYEQALEVSLPADIRAIVDRQRWAIEESRRHLTAWREGRLPAEMTARAASKRQGRGVSRLAGPRDRKPARRSARRPSPRHRKR